MIHFNPHTILPLLTILLALICGIFTIVQNPKGLLNQIFLAICITFAAWFTFYIPFNFNYSEEKLLVWFKISNAFICFIPILCFTFISTYLTIPKNILLFKINSAIGFSLAILSIFTDLLISGINYFPHSPYPKAGLLHFLLIAHCISLSIFSLKILYKKIKNPLSSEKEKNHTKYMFLSIIVLTFGSFDFLGNYNIPINECGSIAVIGYLLITTVSVVKYQLMDIQIIFRKSLIYTLLIASIACIYFLSIYTTEYYIKEWLGYKSIFISLFFAILIATLFIPIKNLLERLIFQNDLGKIAEENELLRKEIMQTERLKSIAILASGLAHEIKNPLTPIKTFTEHLPQKLDDKEFLLKFAKIIPKEVDRIDALVHEMLDFAKPSSPELKPTPIHDLINSLIELLNNNAVKNNIHIQRNFELDFNHILNIDPKQIKQALLNILLNAIEAMPNGGNLIITTTIEDNTPIIAIKDTGKGISPENLKHIFDPFFTQKDHGTGLGLSITHEIIKNHGGKIFVDSALGKGTTFIIELPS